MASTIDTGKQTIKVLPLPDLVTAKKTQRDKDWTTMPGSSSPCGESIAAAGLAQNVGEMRDLLASLMQAD